MKIGNIYIVSNLFYNNHWQKSSTLASHNYHFKWWFEISPIRTLLQARPKGRISQANYRLPLKEVICAYLLAWFLLPVRQYIFWLFLHLYCLLWLHSNLLPKILCSICLQIPDVCRVSSMLTFLSIQQILIHLSLAVCSHIYEYDLNILHLILFLLSYSYIMSEVSPSYLLLPFRTLPSFCTLVWKRCDIDNSTLCVINYYCLFGRLLWFLLWLATPLLLYHRRLLLSSHPIRLTQFSLA